MAQLVPDLFRIVRGDNADIVSNRLTMLAEDAERLADDLRKEFQDDTVRAERMSRGIQYVTVEPAEVKAEYLPERIKHGHWTIGAVGACHEETPCDPRGAVVSFDVDSRGIVRVE